MGRGHEVVLQRCPGLGPGAVLLWQLPGLAGPVPWHLFAWNGISEVVAVLLLPHPPVWFHTRSWFTVGLGGLVAALAPPAPGQAVRAARGRVKSSSPARGHCRRGCTSDPKKSKGQ